MLVALRKESVDRNAAAVCLPAYGRSLSARRAWIEIFDTLSGTFRLSSLSARRAWIEIYLIQFRNFAMCVALRKESVDRNNMA